MINTKTTLTFWVCLIILCRQFSGPRQPTWSISCSSISGWLPPFQRSLNILIIRNHCRSAKTSTLSSIKWHFSCTNSDKPSLISRPNWIKKPFNPTGKIWFRSTRCRMQSNWSSGASSKEFRTSCPITTPAISLDVIQTRTWVATSSLSWPQPVPHPQRRR